MRMLNSVVCALVLFCVAASAQALPFTNGGFDDYVGAPSPNASNLNDQTPVSWIGSNNNADLDTTQGQIAAPHSGSHFFEFKTNNPSYIYQTFDTVPGGNYDLGFVTARPQTNNNNNEFFVDIFSAPGDPGGAANSGDLLDEHIQNGQVPGGGVWTPFSFPFQATSAQTTLRFLDNGTTAVDPAIDTVMVNFLGGGTPLPPSAGPPPLGHWRLDDAAGSPTALDSSGRGHDAAVGSETTLGVPGISLGAADISGANNSGGVEGLDANMGGDFVTGAGARTISAWFNADTFTGGQRGIFGNGHNSGNRTRFDINTESPGGNNSIFFRYQGGNIGWSGITEFGDELQEDQWYHLTVVVPDNALPTDVMVYIDAVLLTPDSGNMNNAGSPLNTGGNFRIGDTAGLFDGSIDDVQYYGEALNAEQITLLFNNPGLSLDQIGVNTIPEPATATLALLATGLVALRRRRRGAG